MMQPSRHAVLLVPMCLLAGSAWLSGCRQADPPGKPHLPVAASGRLAGGRGPAAAPDLQPHEIQLQQDGVGVTSLTYDSRVFFDTDRDRPRPEAGSVLDALAVRLKQGPTPPHVAVLGHTDAVGSDAYNLGLARRRAVTIVHALEARGIDPSTLEPVAAGKRQPVASDGSEAGRARNRRVEFLISPSARAIDALIASRPMGAAFRARHPEMLHLQARQPDALVRAPLGAPVSY